MKVMQRFFFLLAESSSEFIGMCDLGMQPFYVNPAGMRMVGLPDMAAACRVKVMDYFFPEDQAFIEETFFPRVLSEGGGDVEIRLRHFKTGEPIWMFYYLFSLCDDSGEAVGWATVSRDITERKLTEEALRESEYKFSTHIQNTPIGALSWDLDFKAIEWNPAAETIFGYSKAEAMGKHVTELILSEELKEMVDGVYRDLISGKGGTRSTNENITKDGRKIICDWYNTILKDANGKVVGAASLVNDITERINSEINLERIKLAIDQSFDAIGMSTAEGQHFYQNATFTQMFGYDLSEVVVMHPKKLYQDQDIADEVFETISKGDNWTGQIKMVSKNGRQIPIELRANAIKDEHGRVVGFVGIHLDITDRLKLEAKLQQAQKMESIGTLAGGIAHDFNNIMAIIVGNIELALDDVPKWNSAYSSLEEIKKASLRAKNIVKQLLSFSRKTDQEMQPIQIALVIEDALKFLRSTIPTTINIHPNILTTDEMILADLTQINQIIMNLCINASHAMEQTGGDLNVIVAKMVLDDKSARDYPGLKSGDHVKIIISDTGPGIDPEIIDQIFDPYFTTKEVGKGSGMGLAVVHGIVKSHRGAIVVESSQGKGTIFIILFPLIKEKQMVDTKATMDIPRGNETILFVDDEISIIKMVQRMFERLGYKVETATTPEEALDRFSLNPDHFDLVITDMTMPQMTGVKLSEKLKDIREDIPIIVCTGHSNLVDEEKAKEMGLAAYVMKPIDMQKTAQTIRKILDKK
jgi:PAS domain S-box-containing protein